MIFEKVREAPNVHIPATVFRKLSKKLERRSPGDFGGVDAVEGVAMSRESDGFHRPVFTKSDQYVGELETSVLRYYQWVCLLV